MSSFSFSRNAFSVAREEENSLESVLRSAQSACEEASKSLPIDTSRTAVASAEVHGDRLHNSAAVHRTNFGFAGEEPTGKDVKSTSSLIRATNSISRESFENTMEEEDGGRSYSGRSDKASSTSSLRSSFCDFTEGTNSSSWNRASAAFGDMRTKTYQHHTQRAIFMAANKPDNCAAMRPINFGFAGEQPGELIQAGTTSSTPKKPIRNSFSAQEHMTVAIKKEIVDEISAEPATLQPALSFRNYLREEFKVSVEIAPPNICKRFMDHVRSSLGVCYDAVYKNFIATCNKTGKVFCYANMETIANGLGRGAAIAVVEHGISFVVICDTGILIFTASKEHEFDHKQRPISRRANGRFARGLGVTVSRNIVTIQNSKTIIIFKNAEGAVDETLCTFDYAGALGSPQYKNASFMNVRNNRLVISDLGCHRLSTFKIEENAKGTSMEFLHSIDVAVSSMNNYTPPLGKCAFIAGVQLDDDGNVLVVDAKGGTIQFFDSSLNFIVRARQDNHGTKLPYISAIAISPTGNMVGCARKMEGVVPMRLNCIE